MNQIMFDSNDAVIRYHIAYTSMKIVVEIEYNIALQNQNRFSAEIYDAIIFLIYKCIIILQRMNPIFFEKKVILWISK